MDYRIKTIIRKRIYRVLRENKKCYINNNKYYIDYDGIKKQLTPMPNNISYFHIDHIKPLCSFNFINKDGSYNKKQIEEAFAPENHQWLLAEENLKKGGKLNWIK